MPQFINFKFIGLPTLDKADFADSTVLEMGANAVLFPSPKVALADVTIAAQNLRDKHRAHELNPKATKQALINTERDLNKVLRANARYVDLQADGDGAVIEKAGYSHSSRARVLKHKPAQPENVSMSNLDNSGLVCNCDVVEGATTYIGILQKESWVTPNISGNQVDFAAGKPKQFIIDASTKRKKKFFNLERRATYFYGVYCLNTAGTSGMSSTVEKIVS